MKALLLAITIALVTYSCSAQIGTSPKGREIPIENASLKLISDVKEGGYKLVKTQELKNWIDSKKKIKIISALPLEEDKDLGIIPGALNAEMPKTEKELSTKHSSNLLKIAGNDKDATIVVYCGFVACRRSHIASKILVDNGYKNVYRYAAGLAGWLDMGNSLVK